MIRRRGLLGLVFGLVLLSACGGSSGEESQRASPDRAVTSFAEQSECGQVLTGKVEAQDSTLSDHGVAAFEYTFNQKIPERNVTLLDESGNAIGTLSTRVETIHRDPLRATIVRRFMKGGEQKIKKTVEVTRFETGEAWIVADYTSKGKTYRHWFSYDKNLQMQGVTVGRPVDESTPTLSAGTRQSRPSGLYDTIHSEVEGQGLADSQAIKAWSKKAGLKSLIDRPLHRTFRDGERDKNLNRAIAQHISKCEGSNGGQLVRTSSALSTDGSQIQRRRQRACVGNLSDRDRKVLEATANAMSTIDTATLVGEVLIAGGAAGGPLTVAAAFAGAMLAGKAAGKLAGPLLEAGMRGAGKGEAADFFFGSSSGDPHLTTIDGMTYDFQAAGEFTLIESIDGNFEVQVREQSVEGATCANITFNTAIATKVSGDRIGVYARRDKNLWINGEAVSLDNGFLELDGGGQLKASGGSTYTMYWPNGNRFKVKDRGHFLDIYVSLSKTQSQNVHGLLGRPNSDTSDDLSLRNGTVIGDSIDWSRLYGEYADSWRIEPSESLFNYQNGQTTEDYQRPEIPTRPASIQALPQSDIDSARAKCKGAGITSNAVLEDCVLDVACTGNSTFLKSHADRRKPSTEAAVEEPIFVDNWTQQGNGAPANWMVSQDGRSVLQTKNIDPPTMYVSKEKYRETTVQGNITVEPTSDNDVVGFVFGYQKPISQEGHAANNYDMYVFQWRQGTDDWQGHTGREGFALAKVDGKIPAAEQYAPFWGFEDTEGYQLLASDFGSDKGWETGTPYEFTLSYSADRIQIAVNGKVIFDVAASAVGVSEFQNGRFGFYNYSQADVRYGGFKEEGTLRDLSRSKREARGDFKFISPKANLSNDRVQSTDGFIIPETKGVEVDETITFDQVFTGSYFGGVKSSSVPRREGLECSVTPKSVKLKSYLVHYDPSDGQRIEGHVEFEEPIVGIISTTSKLKATDSVFGTEGVTYASHSKRGLDGSQDGFVFNKGANRVSMNFRVRGALDEIRIITLAESAAAPFNDGQPPRSCSDVPSDQRSNGVFTIDPDGQGGTPSFETYCQFDGESAWTRVTKLSSGDPVYADCSWALSGLNLPDSAPASPASKGLYGNRIVNQYWNRNGFKIDEIQVEVYKDGALAKRIEFKGKDTSIQDWFKESNVISSSWNDLTSNPKNFFSITGSGTRDFYINQHDGGCDKDTGWLVANRNRFCSWDTRLGKKGKLRLMYAGADNSVNWTTNSSVALADTMVISVSRAK